MSDQNGLNRRQVLAGAGAAAALGAITFTPKQARAQSWDHETDVIVVGGGAAGCPAAVTAAAAGDSVIVIEKGGVLGGTANKSGGVIWIPNNFTLKRRGIEDSKDDCLNLMCRHSYPERFDPDSPTKGLDPDAFALLEAFYDHGADMIDSLRELGALNTDEWRMWHMNRSAPDYLDHADVNKVPQGRPLGPKTEDGRIGVGADMIMQMEAWLRARNVPLLTEHQAAQLIRNEQGEAIGLVARHHGKDVMVRARKAVIFTTGGYAHNADAIRLYQRTNLYGGCAADVATGDFLAIAEATGAKMGNLGTAWRTQVVVEEALESRVLASGAFMPPGDSMIMVNKYGRRVVNEKRNYNDRTEIHFNYDPSNAEFPNHLLFVVYDQRTAEAFAGNYPLPKDSNKGKHVIKGDTLEELAANLDGRLEEIANNTGRTRLAGAFTDELRAQIERFNAFAQDGTDKEFGRGSHEYDRAWHPTFGPMRPDTEWPANDLPNPTMYPIMGEGPYYAIILGPGVLDTNGGAVVNAKAQIVDADGEPIPGLYGAGNCIASPSREAYYGAGATIGLAMTYGYIAGLNAHKERVKTA
ncbi:MAG: FAD-dependent oxidoreductase [Alphaproteobacteria bacterium]|nr:FAD-dependent oxidoreductase [Alphaproteobacteria bacterium]